MGWTKDAKAKSMATEAQAAWNEGSRYFTPIMSVPAFESSFSGRIKDWELMLDAIGSVGWQLQHWAVASDEKGHPQAMPVFVRSQSPE